MTPIEGRTCFRQPIEEIGVAARLLRDAQVAHLDQRFNDASKLIQAANMAPVRAWTESVWGSAAQEVVQFRPIAGSAEKIPRGLLPRTRMPSTATMKIAVARDGYQCRYCGNPVIESKIRKRIHAQYPEHLQWGRLNIQQHAAFQCMWLQYDHVVPFSRGGSNEIDNIVVSCAPCNFGKMEYTLAEVGLADPRLREPKSTNWNGLIDFLN
jgi:5-methylcytosine-specific restriction endonuclease McrA